MPTLEVSKSSETKSYIYEALANSYSRVASMFPKSMLLLYGDAAASLCCGTELSSGTMTLLLLPNITTAQFKYALASEKGIVVEKPVDSLYKLYDSVNDIDIEIGISSSRQQHMSTDLWSEPVPRQYGPHFAGIPYNELMSRSKGLSVNGKSVNMPAISHNVSILYALWRLDSDGDYKGQHTREIVQTYKHHYNSMAGLEAVPHSAFGHYGYYYSKSMKSDISCMLRV